MRKTLLFVTFSVLLTPLVYSQSSVSDFLLTAFEDVSLNQYNSQLNYINRTNTRLPIIDEVEVRMSNDQRTYEDARYQLRLRPANPWKVRRNNALFNARREEISAEKKLEYKDNLFGRYQLVLEYFEQQELAKLFRNRLTLLDKKTTLFLENSSSDIFDARDFVDSKIEQVEILEQLTTIEGKRNNTRLEILAWMEQTDFDWDTFEIIEPEAIDSIAALISSRNLSSLEIQYLTKRFETARQETRVERADFDLGYIQTEYAPFIDADEKNLGFSLGFTIPIFQKNKPQIAERMLDQLRRENILSAETKIDSINKTLEYGFLLTLTKQHFQLQSDIKNLNLGLLLINLAQSENYDPIAVIKLEEADLLLQEMIIKSKFSVLEQYLDFLYTYDAITETPQINYLAKELSPLE